MARRFIDGEAACNSCHRLASRLGTLEAALKLREKAVEEREVARALAEMAVEGRIKDVVQKHKKEMREYEGKITETLYKKGYVQLEYGGGTVGTVGMKSVEWGERDRVEKTMVDREKNVKKREREVEEKDLQREEWEKAEKKKRLTLEKDITERLQKQGYYISETGKQVIGSQAGMSEEIRARDAAMRRQAKETETLREIGQKADQEKLEYKKKLKEEKDKGARLLQHAASLESALKQRHREGSRVGRLAENEVAKARRATATLSSLTTLSARDKAALAQFRRARKTALQFEKRTAKREMEEESKGYRNSYHLCISASSNAIPPRLLRRLSAIEKAHARIQWLQDHQDFLELRCEAFEDREIESADIIRELADTVRILQLKMNQSPPIIHFGEPNEEWEYDVAEIAFQLFSKRMNASVVNPMPHPHALSPPRPCASPPPHKPKLFPSPLPPPFPARCPPLSRFFWVLFTLAKTCVFHL